MRSLTGLSKRKEYMRQQRMIDKLERTYQPRIRKEISRTMRAVARKLSEPMIVGIEIHNHQDRLEVLLKSLYYTAAEETTKLITGQKSAQRHIETKEVLPRGEVVTRFMQAWLTSYGIPKITQISETTRSDINSVIQNGIAEGLEERKLAQLIESAAIVKSTSRAATIARTEIGAASQSVAMETAKAMELPMVKEWVSSGGERTREAHAEANGQTVGLHEPFIVGGEQLMQPSDPNGSAGNVINCRCAVIFKVLD